MEDLATSCMNLKKATITYPETSNGIEQRQKVLEKKDQINLLHHLLNMYVLVPQTAKPSVPFRSNCQANVC